MIVKPFILLAAACFMQACSSKQAQDMKAPAAVPVATVSPAAYNNTKGYWENGEIIKEFYCPDAKSFFPPIDIKSWNTIPVVNGRLPTYEETMNGTSIHHYGEKENPYVKPYGMTLPKLAYYITPRPITKEGPVKGELVVVIQVVQTAEDTIVGYRFLSGGCGGSEFHNFHFLSDKDVKQVAKEDGHAELVSASGT